MYFEIKEEGRIVEFNATEISEAIHRAFEDLEPTIEEIYETIEEAAYNFERTMYGFAHTLVHWVLQTYFKVTSRNKQFICFDPCILVRVAVVIQTRLRILTESCLKHVHLFRMTQLLRIQDRGTDDSLDHDAHINICSYVSA